MMGALRIFFLQSKEKNFDRFHNNCLRLAINTFLYLPIYLSTLYDYYMILNEDQKKNQ